MLSPQVVDVIKQTVPVLVAHGETLTRHFYRRMFAGNPEVQAFFNPAHQHHGTQQKALAAAICAYAQNIETPQKLGGAIELIAQKHASLGIQPEHYPIVGKHLLGSIQEVLGDACTPQILDAWAQAYGFLAEVLITRERALYAQQEQDHGWCGFVPFEVVRKEKESETITSFYLARQDRLPLRPYKAGQYLTVRVPHTNGHTTLRNYSLSGRCEASHYRISVKREPAGHVSNHLHDQLAVGQTIEVAPPCGEFVLKAPTEAGRPLVLISGGVGITPLLAMLHSALETQPARKIYFVHAAINGQMHAFADEVHKVARAHSNVIVHFRYSDPTDQDRRRERFDSEGFVDMKLIGTLLKGNFSADFYFCGPKPFMAAMFQGLSAQGVPAGAMHYEFFGPAEALQPAAGAKAV